MCIGPANISTGLEKPAGRCEDQICHFPAKLFSYKRWIPFLSYMWILFLFSPIIGGYIFFNFSNNRRILFLLSAGKMWSSDAWWREMKNISTSTFNVCWFHKEEVAGIWEKGQGRVVLYSNLYSIYILYIAFIYFKQGVFLLVPPLKYLSTKKWI